MEEGEVGGPRKHSTEQKSSSMSSSEIHVGKVHYELKSIRNKSRRKRGRKGSGSREVSMSSIFVQLFPPSQVMVKRQRTYSAEVDPNLRSMRRKDILR